MLAKFAFDPTDGFLDHDSYPTSPDGEEEARAQLQRPHDQVRNYLNEVLIPELASASGAEEIGAGPLYAGDEDGTVMGKLLALRAGQEELASQGIPDGSITTEKLSGALILDGGAY